MGCDLSLNHSCGRLLYVDMLLCNYLLSMILFGLDPLFVIGHEDCFVVVMSHVSWGGEQNTIYKGVETFP